MIWHLWLLLFEFVISRQFTAILNNLFCDVEMLSSLCSSHCGKSTCIKLKKKKKDFVLRQWIVTIVADDFVTVICRILILKCNIVCGAWVSNVHWQWFYLLKLKLTNDRQMFICLNREVKILRIFYLRFPDIFHILQFFHATELILIFVSTHERFHANTLTFAASTQIEELTKLKEKKKKRHVWQSQPGLFSFTMQL